MRTSRTRLLGSTSFRLMLYALADSFPFGFPPRLRSWPRLTRASAHRATSFCLVLLCLEPPLGIYCGHTAGPRCGNRLPIDPIGDITGCKDAIDIGVG